MSYIQHLGRRGWDRNLEEQQQDEKDDRGVKKHHMKSEPEDEIEMYHDERSLRSSRCTPTESALCCSQTEINNEPGQYCLDIGCNMLKCGPKKRRPRKREREHKLQQHYKIMATSSNSGMERKLDVFASSLYGTDFNSAVRRHTMFQPQDSKAILDANDIESVATCSVNQYSVEMVCHRCISTT